MRSSARLILAVISICAGLAACGDSQPGPSPTPPITQPPTTTPPPSPPAPPAAPPTLGVTRILAFGDSMTEGTVSQPLPSWAFRLDAGLSRSYPFKLQGAISGRYTAQTVQVFNAGWAGRRASEDRDRFSGVVSDAHPDLILLLEGANDFNAPLATGEGINDRIRSTVAALEDMVRDAGFRRIPVMLATLPPQRDGGRNAGAAAFLTRANDAIKAMAANKGATLVDVYAQFPLSDIGQDGLHPTEAGYQRMADIWLAAVRSRYEQAPSAAPAEDR